ncbi:hypothetical protein [Streptomyces sp. 1222.5]|uniref:hypothetical protein n=1 Tax=unclassified Streptomyces TaxID=2593676 RepID=UPI000AC4E522|nr:hypothetical protein [Streptomyces sp. 1222.5]
MTTPNVSGPRHPSRTFAPRDRRAAEALGEVYFRDNGRRAHGLEVELTDLIDLEFEL